MIKDYSILFNGMSDGNRKFHYSLNSNIQRNVIVKVYNQYLEYVEYETNIDLHPDVSYWIGTSSNLKNRLSSYNKTAEHEVIHYKECINKEVMITIENMVLLKLTNYREIANRDRFVLPIEKNINFFIDTVDNCINFFI